MSKNDQIKVLREKAYAERQERARQTLLPPLKPIDKGRDKYQRPKAKSARAAELQAQVNAKAPPSHPDCQRCNANREKTRERMRARRAK